MNPARDLDDLHALHGLSPVATYEALYDLASNVPATDEIVELGTFRGKSACFLAAGAAAGEGAHVTTIDPHDLPGQRSTTARGPKPPNPMDYTDPGIREHAVRQIEASGYGDRVRMRRDFSAHAGAVWRGPKVGLLFIDGDHREPAVRHDFAAWERHLSTRAVVAWDDYRPAFPGVLSVIDQLVGKGILTEPYLVGTLAVTLRVER